MPPQWEYKVLGQGSVETEYGGSTSPRSLDDALTKKIPLVTEAILNSLGQDGWEAVSLTYPYVFKRPKS